MRTKSLFILTAILIPVYLSAQSISLTTSSPQAKAAFTEARDITHLVWMSGGVEQMEKAVELDSTFAIAHAYLAVMIKPFLARDNSHAITQAKKYAPLASDGEQLMIAGWLNFALRDWDKAIDNWEKLLKKYPDDPYARHILGDVYRIKKRYNDAIKTFKGLVNRPDPFVPAYNHFAYAYLSTNEEDSAYATMQKFIDGNPKNANAYDSMADIMLKKGNIQAAIAYLQRAVLADDRLASAQSRIGDLLLENNEPFLARKAYEKALEMSSLYGEPFRERTRKKIAEIEKPYAMKNNLPDPLAAGWKNKAVCEVLQDNSKIRALKCTFPSGVGHEKHRHAAHFGYTIAGSKFRITDTEGTRDIVVLTGNNFYNDEIEWHEVVNIGDSTAVFLIIEPK